MLERDLRVLCIAVSFFKRLRWDGLRSTSGVRVLEVSNGLRQAVYIRLDLEGLLLYVGQSAMLTLITTGFPGLVHKREFIML